MTELTAYLSKGLVWYNKLIAQAKTQALICITRSIQPWKNDFRSENLYGEDVALKEFLQRL